MAVAGNPLRSGVMSEPVTEIEVEAVLFATLLSFVALVVPLTVEEPTAVGVPATVHVMEAPGARLTGGLGAQTVVKPAGRPETVHVAAVAVTAGDAALVHLNVPL